jgi:endonuclease YncB( thermonuclease family)
MTNKFKAFVLSLALLAAPFAIAQTSDNPPAVVGKYYSCRVDKVWDGDTFDALCAKAGEVRVRLYQVDAPEKNQPRGVDALRWLKTKVWNQTVSVKLIAIEGATPDHQQRWVGRVLLNRSSVNLQAVANGWAWAAPGFTKPGDSIRTAERKARASKLGVWQDPNPIAPWDWRHGRREPK